MGYNTKIDWCDTTWNPVTGCLHGCEYCYARGIATRFGGYNIDPVGDSVTVYDACAEELIFEVENPVSKVDDKGRVRVAPYPFGFDPTFHRYRLDQPTKWSEPRTIFVCSMADLFGEWVPDEWIEEVFNACRAAPQHRYLFLTKKPDRYFSLHANKKLPKEKNFYYGITMDTKQNAQEHLVSLMSTSKNIGFNYANVFASVEPILEDFGPVVSAILAAHIPWIIVGAETGKRKGIVRPEREWVMRLSEESDQFGTAIFMKESLREIMGDDFKQEFPW